MENNDNLIDSGAILEKIQFFEQKTYDIMNSNNKLKRNSALIDNYKDMIKYLMDNQLFKESEFNAKFIGDIFMKVKRKEYVQFIQTEIAKMLKENKTEMIIYNQLKTSVIKAISSRQDVYYLNNNLKNELNDEIEKKLSIIDSTHNNIKEDSE